MPLTRNTLSQLSKMTPRRVTTLRFFSPPQGSVPETALVAGRDQFKIISAARDSDQDASIELFNRTMAAFQMKIEKITTTGSVGDDVEDKDDAAIEIQALEQLANELHLNDAFSAAAQASLDQSNLQPLTDFMKIVVTEWLQNWLVDHPDTSRLLEEAGINYIGGNHPLDVTKESMTHVFQIMLTELHDRLERYGLEKTSLSEIVLPTAIEMTDAVIQSLQPLFMVQAVVMPGV